MIPGKSKKILNVDDDADFMKEWILFIYFFTLFKLTFFFMIKFFVLLLLQKSFHFDIKTFRVILIYPE
jgi:hypothetical protein